MIRLESAAEESAPAESTRASRPWLILAGVAAVGLMLFLRLIALSSDPYPNLDWSAGQLTDEGFYIHNARNVALYGHPRTDEFNNMLLSPLLHYLQTAVFLVFGVGSVQARLISVVCSLLTLLLFWAAIRRAFGIRVAAVGTLFLGLDHSNLLFNRMALMDTPATLTAVAALYAFVRGTEPGERKGYWFGLCGFFLAITIIDRSLCAYLLPIPFIALRSMGRPEDGSIGRWKGGSLGKPVVAGMSLVFAVYLAIWYFPNRAELQHLTHHYRVHQIQPDSIKHFAMNVQHAFFGDTRGFVPYMLRHAPVQFILALIAIFGAWRRGEHGLSREPKQLRSQSPDHPPTQRPNDPITQRPDDATTRYLQAWLVLGLFVLTVISYSPSRYYVPIYPALAALAAIAFWEIPSLWSALWSESRHARLTRAMLAGVITYHLFEFLIHRDTLAAAPTFALLNILPSVIGVGAYAWRTRWIPRNATAILVVWMVVNFAWYAHWARGLAYTQIDLSKELGRTLPADSVLIGDVAPGICLDNRLMAINMIPMLCNSTKPIERFNSGPRYICVLQHSPLKKTYWRKKYPQYMTDDRREITRPALIWQLEMYAVNRPKG